MVSPEKEEAALQDEEQKKLKAIKDELILHSAKAVITDGTTSGFRFFGALLSLGVFLVPAYAALIRVLLGENIRQTLLIASIPIAFWLTGIALCLYLMLPRMGWVDMQNPRGIFESNQKALSLKLKLSWIVAVTLLLGVSLAAYVLITPTVELIHLESFIAKLL